MPFRIRLRIIYYLSITSIRSGAGNMRMDMASQSTFFFITIHFFLISVKDFIFAALALISVHFFFQCKNKPQ